MMFVRKVFGFTLVELIIAMSIGMIVIGAVTSIFLKGNAMASARSLELLLQQDTNDALQIMKQEILRAGYNGQSNATSSLKLSGANSVIYFDPSKNCIAFVYDADGKHHYRSFYEKNNELWIYTNKFDAITSPLRTISAACKGGWRFFNPNIISSSIRIIETPISSATASSQMITIKLRTHLVRDNRYSAAKSIAIKTRNWS